MQLTDDWTKQGKFKALIEDIQCRLTVAKDDHATCLKKLEAEKVQQLSDEKFGKALSVLDEQISATKLKLASVSLRMIMSQEFSLLHSEKHRSQ